MRPIYIPPIYIPEQLDKIEEELLALQWETKRTARHEYFMADQETNYSYGRRDDGITYTSKPWSRWVDTLRRPLWVMAGGAPFVGDDYYVDFNGCFLNKYDDHHQHLGWHADDFEGMDPAAPIAVMSFGAEREIWIKRQFAPCEACDGKRKIVRGPGFGGMHIDEVSCIACEGTGNSEKRVTGLVPPEDRYLLERGSLFIMPPGFQEVMLHRIPKHPQPCGWRISLTFRKFL